MPKLHWEAQSKVFTLDVVTSNKIRAGVLQNCLPTTGHYIQPEKFTCWLKHENIPDAS